LDVDCLGVDVLQDGVLEGVEQKTQALLQDDGGSSYLDVIPVGESTHIQDLDFFIKVSRVRLLPEMQPVDHLHSIAVLDVCDVQVILEFNDLEALDLSEFRHLVVEQHFIGIRDVEEGPVSIDLCFGVAWEMRPHVFGLGTEDDLLRGQSFKLRVDEEGAAEQDNPDHEQTHGNETPFADNLLLGVSMMQVLTLTVGKQPVTDQGRGGVWLLRCW